METILIVAVIGLLFGLLGGTRSRRSRIASGLSDDLVFGDHTDHGSHHVHHEHHDHGYSHFDGGHHDSGGYDGGGYDGGGHH